MSASDTPLSARSFELKATSSIKGDCELIPHAARTWDQNHVKLAIYPIW
ncbi:hypothetical protein [Roseovarius albus]|nr:hypothetical protein [Roseovarius albus]